MLHSPHSMPERASLLAATRVQTTRFRRARPPITRHGTFPCDRSTDPDARHPSAFYGDDLSTSPLITRAGLIVWPGPDDTVFALDRAGMRQWTSQVDGQPLSPALAPDGTIVVGDRSGSLRGLRPPSGTGQPRTVGSIDLGSTSYASPAIAQDGTIYTTLDTPRLRHGA
jgi:outer membrane protein assembly factor BamB